MGKIFVILILFISLTSAFSCNSSDTKKVSEVNKNSTYENPYFPITDGSYWTYINEAPREETVLFTVKAEDTIKIEGGTQLQVSSFPYMTKDEKEVTLRQKSNGEIEAVDYFGGTGTFIPAAENFKKGYEWQYGIYRGYISPDTASVKTESGSFNNCYYVMMTEGFTFSFEMWYKKDVGIVKWGANRTNPPSMFTYYVLKEYKIN